MCLIKLWVQYSSLPLRHSAASRKICYENPQPRGICYSLHIATSLLTIHSIAHIHDSNLHHASRACIVGIHISRLYHKERTTFFFVYLHLIDSENNGPFQLNTEYRQFILLDWVVLAE